MGEHNRKATAHRTAQLVLLAFLLIALLLLLVPNLHRIELAPGQPFDLNPGALGTPASSGDEAHGWFGFSILLQALFIAALTGLAVIAIASIFRRRLRPYLLLYVISFLLTLGLHSYLANRRPETVPMEAEGIEMASPEHSEAKPPVAETPSPPAASWFVVVAVSLSTATATLLAIVWAKLAPRWRRARALEVVGPLRELLDSLGVAADEIELGGDARQAVLRCYREMIRVLCTQGRIEHSRMTARELAAALHRVGFTARHVDQLTEIFELVRYGRREGQQLAVQAARCLDEIRRAYAT